MMPYIKLLLATNKFILPAFFLVIFLLAGFGYYYAIGGFDPEPTKRITNFEECVAAGNPIAESYPRKCITTDGRSFTEKL